MTCACDLWIMCLTRHMFFLVSRRATDIRNVEMHAGFLGDSVACWIWRPDQIMAGPQRAGFNEKCYRSEWKNSMGSEGSAPNHEGRRKTRHICISCSMNMLTLFAWWFAVRCSLYYSSVFDELQIIKSYLNTSRVRRGFIDKLERRSRRQEKQRFPFNERKYVENR